MRYNVKHQNTSSPLPFLSKSTQFTGHHTLTLEALGMGSDSLRGLGQSIAQLEAKTLCWAFSESGEYWWSLLQLKRRIDGILTTLNLKLKGGQPASSGNSGPIRAL
jgi:hypothetical protein